jgi:Mycothiol maleylpyruvate isomerase N-terminal domain
MVEWPDPRWAYAPLLTLERRRLLDLLQSLDPPAWNRPTPCPGRSVLALVTHLVGDDLGFISWQRDRHHGTPAATAPVPVWLDHARELSQRWLHRQQHRSSVAAAQQQSRSRSSRCADRLG